MRRSLLVVFVLQLFWNMAGFAVVGHGYERTWTDRPSVSVSVADVQAIAGKGLVDQAHGLLDELPDLPDSLVCWRQPNTMPDPTPAHMACVGKGSPTPSPEALLRPPQRV